MDAKIDNLSNMPLNQIVCADALELANSLPPESVDMILCDLPYGTTACSWDTVIPFDLMWSAFSRVIKPNCAIVLTASQPFTAALVMSNLDWFRYSWVWVKNMGSNFLNTDYVPMKEHEDVCVFGKGTLHYFPQPKKRTESGASRSRYAVNPYAKKREVYGGAAETHMRHGDPDNRVPSSVVEFACERGLHPTQKPVALFEYLIRTYTSEGDLVFDPCCGSGTTAVAARSAKREFICGDTSLPYVLIGQERLRLPFDPHIVAGDDDVSDLPLFSMEAR